MNTVTNNQEGYVSQSKTPYSERIPGTFKPVSKSIILLTFILNIVLIYPILFPNLSDIGMFDESLYINSGRVLVEDGNIPEYAWNPLVACLYAITYIPVQKTTFWLIHSCTIGRFILFGLLWLSAYLVAKQLSSLGHPLVMIIFVLVSPALTYLLGNQSDALFAAMSAFALWQVLSFRNEKKIKHLWFASLFVGLSALARNDGLILFFSFLILALFLSIPIRRLGTALIASVIPFVIIVGGYITLYSLITGKFEFGTMRRTYWAFEQGQGFAYGYSAADGQIETRRLFGTPKENNYSVITAILRNPEAFIQRVRQTVKTSYLKIYFMYGERLGIVIFLLAAMGAVELARKKLYALLLILWLWPVHLFVYLFTFFRHTYFLLPYFVTFSLASFGITSIVDNLGKKALYIWSFVLLGLASFGILTDRPNIFSATVFFTTGLWILWLIMNQYRNLKVIRPIELILALCFAVLLKGGFPYPKFRTLGIAPDERAALYMKEHLNPKSMVLTYAPGNVLVAKMDYYPLNFELRNINEQEFSSSVAKYAKAIYVDNDLRHNEPIVWAKIEKMIGSILEVGFKSDDGSIQVLVVKKDSQR